MTLYLCDVHTPLDAALTWHGGVPAFREARSRARLNERRCEVCSAYATRAVRVIFASQEVG